MNDPFSYEKNRAHLKALWDAYFEATGLPALTPSHRRMLDLRELDRRGVTADEVRAVVRWLRVQMSRPKSNFTDTALDWRNLMGRADTFEEHLAKVRLVKERRKPAAAMPPAPTAPSGTSEEEAARLRALAKQQVEELKRRMGR